MADDWYVGKGGQQSGPFAPTQLRQMAASGQLSPGDLLWKDGLPNWVPASSIKGLFPEAGQFPPPAASRPAPRPTAPPPRAPLPTEGRLIDGSLNLGNPAVGGQWPSTPDVFPGVTGATGPLAFADFLPRVGATLLDGLFVGLLGCIPMGMVVVLIVAANANTPENGDAAAAALNVCGQIISFIVSAIYYVTLDASTKQGTWGKQIVGLKVTDLEGRRIGVGRAIGRFFARYLSICTCGIGFLLPLFTEKKQTLHDLISGCLVLKK